MRDFRSILNIIGILLCIEAIAMIIPMIYDIAYSNEDWQQFLFSSLTFSCFPNGHFLNLTSQTVILTKCER